MGLQVFEDFISGVLPKDQKETELWLQRFLPDFRIVRHEKLEKGMFTAESEVAVAYEEN